MEIMPGEHSVEVFLYICAYECLIFCIWFILMQCIESLYR